MHLKGLSLQNYRNIAGVSLGLAPGFWAILGENGQGKTNLLEAVAVLCCGRSFRTEKDRELVRFGESFARLEGKFERERRGELSLMVRLSADGKELRVNGNPAPRLADYSAEAGFVVFCVQDADIVLGEPGVRREFLNEAISQTSKGYVYDLARFKRALEQKNRALKDVRERLAPPGSLDIWDAPLADYGGRVCARRSRFVRRLSEALPRVYAELSGGAEELAISYNPSVPVPDAADQWPAALLAASRERRQEEIARGVTLAGPQRDDLDFTLSDVDARAFASRGQARSIALAVRLAQMHLAWEQTGEWPLALMDDVFSELDAGRRCRLLAMASQADQVFATAACAADLPHADDGMRVLRVSAGEVREALE